MLRAIPHPRRANLTTSAVADERQLPELAAARAFLSEPEIYATARVVPTPVEVRKRFDVHPIFPIERIDRDVVSLSEVQCVVVIRAGRLPWPCLLDQFAAQCR